MPKQFLLGIFLGLALVSLSNALSPEPLGKPKTTIVEEGSKITLTLPEGGTTVYTVVDLKAVAHCHEESWVHNNHYEDWRCL